MIAFKCNRTGTFALPDSWHMTRQSYDPLNDTNVRKEARPDGSYALFGSGNKHLGSVAAPLSPAELGRRQYEQDAAYIAARNGQPQRSAPAPNSFMTSGIQSSGGLGTTSLSNNTYGQPINRANAGLPTPQEVISARADDPERAKRVADARKAGTFGQTMASFNRENAGRQRMDATGNIFDLQSPYQRSLDAINRGDVSAFRGQARTPASVFAGQALNGGSGKTYGVDGGSVTFNGGGLPKGYAGYQTADGKYKTIGPNGEVGIHDNEQAAIASFGAQPAAPVTGYEQRPVSSFTPAQQMTMQQPQGSAAGRGFGVVNAANPTAPASLPSYTDVLAPAPAPAATASVATGRRQYAPPAATPDAPRALTASELARNPTRPAAPAPAPRQAAAPRATDGRGNARPQPAQVMAYNAPGNPISPAAPQDLSQSPVSAAPAPAPLVTPSMQTGTGALGDMKPLQDVLRTTSPTAQLNSSLKSKSMQPAYSVFTRPRNLSMRNGYMPA